mmetsp:Transcript_2376/g.5639  ORF Transcript_2376/g.5639 Transcript_2376/m.5639 type:complete len:628 (+) Transcript_2376:22-1905(+)
MLPPFRDVPMASAEERCSTTRVLESLAASRHALAQDEMGPVAINICGQLDKVEPVLECADPIIVLEGADGVGKSTLASQLKQSLCANVIKTPPAALGQLRSHFDAAATEVRRSFYMLGNYMCASQLRQMAGPVVVDRFWPSSVAYALACDLRRDPSDFPTLLDMPRDLVDLLPFGARPVIFLVLELSEEDRAPRVRTRGVPMTGEEEVLERQSDVRQRLACAYRALRLPAGQALEFLDASGDPGDVLLRAQRLIQARVQSHHPLVPRSVNWHYTRQCNYSCKFCFHTAKTSFFLPATAAGMEEAKECLRRLRRCGMEKMNFSGGEPFLHPKELGELCRFCKQDLVLPSVSIVSNGSKITERWLQDFGRYVDILAVSCDSFHEETNFKTGRGKGSHIQQLEAVRQWCEAEEVLFKVNTVVNALNVDEDMAEGIRRLRPIRWKVFQCLLLEGENAGEEALRDAKKLTVSSEQFSAFLQRHKEIQCLVPEDNEKMKDSYLILDEEMRFLNCTGGAKRPTASLRHVPIVDAVRDAGFDSQMFLSRGGVYGWTRPGTRGDLEDLAGPKTLRSLRTPARIRARNIRRPRPLLAPTAPLGLGLRHAWGQTVLLAAGLLAAGALVALTQAAKNRK